MLIKTVLCQFAKLRLKFISDVGDETRRGDSMN